MWIPEAIGLRKQMQTGRRILLDDTDGSFASPISKGEKSKLKLAALASLRIGFGDPANASALEWDD